MGGRGSRSVPEGQRLDVTRVYQRELRMMEFKGLNSEGTTGFSKVRGARCTEKKSSFALSGLRKKTLPYSLYHDLYKVRALPPSS